LLLCRAELTDLFVDANQVVAELLQPMKLGDLLLRLAQRGWMGEGFCHGLSGHSSRQPELGIMTRIICFGAMAGRLAATPDHRCDRSRPEIPPTQELL
jgi:hypothetical protein